MNKTLEDTSLEVNICEHIKPGCFCPECGCQHCTNENGHEYNNYDYCIYCGADGFV